MNGRKAKALRRWARRTASGLPERALVGETGRTVMVPTDKRDSMGKPIMRPAGITGTLRHKPTTVRAVYQRYKAIYGHADLRRLQ